MKNIVFTATPRICLAISVIAILSVPGAINAQTVNPLTPSHKYKVPTFADVGKKMISDQLNKYADIGKAIHSGKPLDQNTCTKAIRSCRAYLGNRGNAPGRTTFSISYSFTYGQGNALTQSDARSKLYEMAANECDRIKGHFEGDCSMKNFTVRNNNRRDVFTVIGSAQYIIE